MRTFNVYSHPVQGFKAVKAGFSWPGLFFGFFWMLVKGLWGLAILWFMLSFATPLATALVIQLGESGALSPSSAELLGVSVYTGGYLALWLAPGFRGNKWRERNLAKRGYEFLSAVRAKTPDAAIAEQARAA